MVSGGPAPLASSPARAASCPWIGSTAPVATRVQQVMSQITEAQELALVNGGSGSYAGNIPAIPALCIPAVNLEDGPQGVGDGQCCVTQLPAPVAAASTWDTSLEQQYGAVVGSEEAARGPTSTSARRSTSSATPGGAAPSRASARTRTSPAR